MQDTLFKSELGADTAVWGKPWEYGQLCNVGLINFMSLLLEDWAYGLVSSGCVITQVSLPKAGASSKPKLFWE